MSNFEFIIDTYERYNKEHYRVLVVCIQKTQYNVPFIDNVSENITVEIAKTDNKFIAEYIVGNLEKEYK